MFLFPGHYNYVYFELFRISWHFLGHQQQDLTQSSETALIKVCDDGLSHDAIKTEVIEMSKDSLVIMETGKKFFLLNFALI